MRKGSIITSFLLLLFSMVGCNNTATNNDKESGKNPLILNEGKQIQYGIYPQSFIGADEEDLKAALDNIQTKDENGWVLYEGKYYAEVAGNPILSGIKYSDGSDIIYGQKCWFRCEPIVWDVLNKNKNEYILMSSTILDVKAFSIRDNNYENSDVRQWMNEDFFNNAFRLNNKNLIENSITDVSKSELKDKVFLPSYSELINPNYGFLDSSNEDENRRALVNDYVLAKHGAFQGDFGLYWTRSLSNQYSSKVYAVNYKGKIDLGTVNLSYIGVRPCISIKL